MKSDLIRASSCDQDSILSDPIRDSRSLYGRLVSIIRLENLRTKARMPLIPGQKFFGVGHFGAPGECLTVLEELYVVASGGLW